MNILELASGTVGTVAGLIATLIAARLQAMAKERDPLRNLPRAQHNRLVIRTTVVTSALAAAVAFIAIHQMALAGASLILMSIARLASPRKEGWGINRLEVHILTETMFHATALVGLTSGLNVLILSLLEDLQTGHRVTITLTLGLATLVAINKSTTRTRKLCTEISKQVSSLVQHIAALQDLHELDKANDKIPDKKRECYEKMHVLEMALDTRLNTGYRYMGTRILPVSAYATLFSTLRAVIANPSKEHAAWEDSKPFLAALRSGCAKHIDVVA
ncbi:hypothetical protein [Streptomyces mutabilis]|uniref:hypothetical protein n=1 Tax=Streptomyces mutabilis TaxID=67332 RepID=UPI00342F4F41